MKFQLKTIALLSMMSFAIFSCSKDDDNSTTTPTVADTGSIKLKFDNVVGNGSAEPDDLKLGTAITMSNGEVIKVDRINYIISNLVLVKEDGTEVKYSKDSLFIINEDQAKNEIVLSKLPTGKYKKLKFGLGVEKSYWEKGEAAQQKFWDFAKSDVNKMTWSWTSGYKFVNFEGTYTSTTVTTPANFKVHFAGYTPNNNYREITVDFPAAASVEKAVTPSVHLFADVKQILDGTNKVNLTEQPEFMGGGDVIVKIGDNLVKIFSVDHVHAH